jgi:hypothetical protein
MTTHLKTCAPAKLARVTAAQPEELLMLRVQGKDSPVYWLDLAVKPGAKLAALDKFLRDIWLECCGHLSAFFSQGRRDVSKRLPVGAVLGSIGGPLSHEYDFGSTTELVIKLSGTVTGATRNAVHLLARNEPPVWPCHQCGQPASAICVECMYEDKGFCCAKHAEDHACGEDMLLPVVNSPRMGVCGYTGGLWD